MPYGQRPIVIEDTNEVVVPGIPSLDTRFVEIGGEIHECSIVDDDVAWDWEDAENGASSIEYFKTEQLKNDLQHRFPAPHTLVEDGKIAEVKYLRFGIVRAPLSEMDHYGLIDGGYLEIKHKKDDVFTDRLFYLTGGRQFQFHAGAPVALMPSVFYGDGSYTDLRAKFKSLAIKGGAVFTPKAFFPFNIELSATKTTELRVEFLELSPIILLEHDKKTRNVA